MCVSARAMKRTPSRPCSPWHQDGELLLEEYIFPGPSWVHILEQNYPLPENDDGAPDYTEHRLLLSELSLAHAGLVRFGQWFKFKEYDSETK